MVQKLFFSSVLCWVLCALSVPTAAADALDKARDFMLYKRYDRAEELLREYVQNKGIKDKHLPYAYYLLVENFLIQKRTNDAKKAAQEAMGKLPSAPFTMIALAGVLLSLNQEDEARPLFENALQQSKYKDPRLVAAYVRAYAQSRYGNTGLVLSRLQNLPERFNKTSEYFTAVADFHKRRREQNDVYKNYQQAILKNGNDLEARYKMGRFFLAQKNKENFLDQMETIVAKDPQFAPAYYDLYSYYYNKDVKKAREYFQLYKDNTDLSPSVEFEELSILYASQEYQEAINKTKQYLLKQQTHSDIRAYRLIAYSYYKLDDAQNAYLYLDSFLTQAEPRDPDIILPTNYRLMGDLLAGQNESARAISFYQKGFLLDTVVQEQKQFAEAIVELAKKTKDYSLIASWMGKIAHLHNPSLKQDLFRWGIALDKAQEYAAADSVFSEYIQRYPDEYYGYYWSARSKLHLDTSYSASAPLFQKAISILDSSQDESVIKGRPKLLAFCYNYLYVHAAETLKDLDLAVVYLDKLIELSPAEKAESLTKAKEQLLEHIQKLKQYEEEMRKYEERKQKYELEKHKAKSQQ